MELKPRLEFMGLLKECGARHALALLLVFQEMGEEILFVGCDAVPVFLFKQRSETRSVLVVGSLARTCSARAIVRARLSS